MNSYVIMLPNDFNEYEWEFEIKGCLEVDIRIYDFIYTFNFYDLIRLTQTIEDGLKDEGHFFDENIVILRSVTVENIKEFIEKIIDTPYLSSFVARSSTESTVK